MPRAKDNQYECQWHQFPMEYGNVTKEEMPNLFMAIVLEKYMEESCRTMRGGIELMTREVRPASFNPDQVQGP